MAINDVKVKTKIQNLLADNAVPAGGDFYSNELDEGSFIVEMEKNFNMTPVESNCDVDVLLEKVIKTSTVKVRGMISSKELKASKFFNELFKNFEIEML
jgi:hypothetical protein